MASKEWEMRIIDSKHKILYSSVGQRSSLHFFLYEQFSDHLPNMDDQIPFQKKKPTKQPCEFGSKNSSI